MIKIEGVSNFHGRMQGMNLMGGQTNSLEFTQTLFKMPKLEDWLEIYDKRADE